MTLSFKQECIPVGCIVSAAVAICMRGVCPGVVSPGGVAAQRGVCPGGVFSGGVHLPPVDRILGTRL